MCSSGAGLAIRSKSREHDRLYPLSTRLTEAEAWEYWVKQERRRVRQLVGRVAWMILSLALLVYAALGLSSTGFFGRYV